MYVLIVDDERDIRDSLAEFFEDEGFGVCTAANGREALERLSKDELPNVIVLDLLMPIMNGIELYDKMRADERLAPIPVVVLTSDPSRVPGGLPVLKKPVSLAKLMGAVLKAVA